MGDEPARRQYIHIDPMIFSRSFKRMDSCPQHLRLLSTTSQTLAHGISLLVVVCRCFATGSFLLDANHDVSCNGKREEKGKGQATAVACVCQGSVDGKKTYGRRAVRRAGGGSGCYAPRLGLPVGPVRRATAQTAPASTHKMGVNAGTDVSTPTSSPP